jgi:hypothetical protein
MAAIPPTPTPNLVLLAGVSQVGLPILIQLMDGRQHGMPLAHPPSLHCRRRPNTNLERVVTDPNPYTQDGARMPAWNAAPRTPNPYTMAAL